MALDDKYLVIYPDGHMEWALTSREGMKDLFRSVIGTDWLQTVNLHHDLSCMIDGVGRIRNPQQHPNMLASHLYPGRLWYDMLYGPVIVGRHGFVGRDYVFIPPTERDLRLIELILNKELPPDPI